MIEEAETKLLKGLLADMPHLTETQILSVYLKELGAIAYHLPEEKTDLIFSET